MVQSLCRAAAPAPSGNKHPANTRRPSRVQPAGHRVTEPRVTACGCYRAFVLQSVTVTEHQGLQPERVTQIIRGYRL